MLTFIGALVFGAPAELDISRAGGATRLSFNNGPAFHTTRASVVGARIIDLPGSTSVAIWQEKSKGGNIPYYAVSLDGRNADAVQQASFDLKLKHGSFDPLTAVPAVEPDLKADETNRVYMVQFRSQTLDEYRDALRNAGATIDYYMPDHAYVVRMDAETKQAVEAMDFVRWVGAYEPAYRLETDLLGQLENKTLPTQRYNIQVYESGPAQKSVLVNLIRGIGGRVDAAIPDGYMVIATLTPDQLREVLKFNEVFFVDKWSPLEEDMNIARDLSGALYVDGLGNYRGQGVRGQVRDGGVRATHQGFSTNPNAMLVRSNSGDTSHGTCTTGIVFGNGTGSATGKGMLPEAQAIFIAGLALGANRYNETAALLAAPYFAVFESNSTGSARTRAYGTESFTMDDILFKLNILICQSQSNAGNQDSRPQAWAKNIVSVGGINHEDTMTTADDNWSSSGSIGPAADGRIKPDLAHFYDFVSCTSNTSDTSYTSGFGGTSAATPITCGYFGLFFQMWADGVFGQTVTGPTVFDARPKNTLAKAMMVNTATQWTFSGATHDLTRTHQGWGRADVRKMYDLRDKMFFVNEEHVLTNLQKKTYKLYVPVGQPELKITMVYNDPPGTTSATQHRINDVTLKVTAPDGTIYYGNNGLLANMYSTPGGVPNTIDTVENVLINAPATGTWTIDVSADQLNADAVVETVGIVDVDYALVASGVHAASPPSAFAVVNGTIASGGLPQLLTSNNQRLEIGTPVLLNNAYTATMTANGIAPNKAPQALRCKIETSCTASEVGYKLFLREYRSGKNVQVGAGATTTGDSTFEVNLANASRFVFPNREIRATVEFSTPQGSSNNTWSASVDQIRWFFTP
jgi:serine protease AprX